MIHVDFTDIWFSLRHYCLENYDLNYDKMIQLW